MKIDRKEKIIFIVLIFSVVFLSGFLLISSLNQRVDVNVDSGSCKPSSYDCSKDSNPSNCVLAKANCFNHNTQTTCASPYCSWEGETTGITCYSCGTGCAPFTDIFNTTCQNGSHSTQSACQTACAGNKACSTGICKIGSPTTCPSPSTPSGETCSLGGASGICCVTQTDGGGNNGGGTNLPGGSSCTGGGTIECASTYCCANGAPASTGQTGTCSAVGQTCATSGGGTPDGGGTPGNGTPDGGAAGGGNDNSDSSSNKDCTDDNQCPRSEFCGTGNCKVKRKNGDNCSRNRQCQSGNCSSGLCKSSLSDTIGGGTDMSVSNPGGGKIPDTGIVEDSIPFIILGILLLLLGLKSRTNKLSANVSEKEIRIKKDSSLFSSNRNEFEESFKD